MTWKTYVIIGSVILGLAAMFGGIPSPEYGVEFGTILAIWFIPPIGLIAYGLYRRSKERKLKAPTA